MSIFTNALILTGPTACGKTTLALQVAEALQAEIIALDSMTVYRGMDIGTAKPTPAERSRVPHHLIDVLDPWESLTVAWWLDRANQACRDIVARGKRPLFVGGTPFYLKALLHGLFPSPPADEALRRTLEAEAEQQGAMALHARLALVDAKTAARLHPNDVRRVVRALEVYSLTNRPISEWQQTWDSPSFANDPIATAPRQFIPGVVLVLPKELLYDRINSRVDAMFAAGWIDEVQRLRELPQPPSREAQQALGYPEIMAYLEGNGLNLAETQELIRTHTRQFAKRQLTWFRHFQQLVPIPAQSGENVEQILKIFTPDQP